MKDLMEIRWHGRGGQGAKTAALLLAEAAMESGSYIQAFPEYGPERSGAPIQAFTRISKHPITIHSGVERPDIIVVIDPSLLETVDVAAGTTADSIIIINSDKSPENLRDKLNHFSGKIGTVDATSIALDTLNAPMPNLPMLGALLKVNPMVSLEDMEENIRNKFTKKIGKEKTNANIDGVRKAYQEVKVQ